MIGARFDGPVELINYHAQQERSNSGGDWKLMENEWARIINCRNNPNVTAQTITDVKIMVTFPSTTTKRPNGFIVDFKYNGTAQIQRPIPNP